MRFVEHGRRFVLGLTFLLCAFTVSHYESSSEINIINACMNVTFKLWLWLYTIPSINIQRRGRPNGMYRPLNEQLSHFAAAKFVNFNEKILRKFWSNQVVQPSDMIVVGGPTLIFYVPSDQSHFQIFPKLSLLNTKT